MNGLDNKKIKVLLIEDNPGDARLIRELLAEVEGAPFDLYHTDWLSAGLGRLAQGDIDVILLDLSLPDSKGLDSLGKFHAQAPKVPIVVLSGLSDEAVAVKAVQEGAQDYLVKGSIDGSLLVRSLRYAIERHRLRVELHESEARYRLLADNVADIVWTADAEARITYVSPSIKRLLGYTVDEAMKLKIGDILTADSLEQARRFVKGQMNMRAWGMHYPPASMTLEHVRKDGSTVWAEVMLSFMQSQDGSIIGIMGATRDITERRVAEEALRESETRFRTVFEGTKVGIALIDMFGKPLNINPAFQRMFGYTFEEFRKLTNLEYLHPDDAMVDAKLYLEMSKGKLDHYTVDKRYIRKDGGVIWGRQHLSVDRGAEGKPRYFIAMVEDITERRMMEEELRRLSDAVRMSSDSITITDLEGTIIDVNEATLKVQGAKSKAELLGLKPYEAIVPEDQEGALRDLAKVMEEGYARDIQYHVLTRDGRRLLVETSASLMRGANGEPIGVVAVSRDITERKRMEEALRQREQNYLLLLESTFEGMVVVDAETLKVVFGNRRALKMFGFDPILRDGIGLNFLDLVHPEDREAVVRGVVEDLQTLERRKKYEVRAKTKDGREIWVDALATRIEFQGRLAILLSMKDVTERKRVEEERRRLEEQIQLAGRLAAVGELAAGVAHELNNPIAAIRGFAQLLNGRKDVDEATKKDLSTIYSEAQRASRITQNLLTFARKHEPEKRLISMNEALEKTLELRTHQMTMNNIELVLELDAELPRTMADSHQMQQVFLNIINNAEQSMVEAHGKGRLEVKTEKAGGLIRITFSDDGPGIPEENLEKIFDPFFTTKEVGKGTGLGLSICYGLVEAHGGRIHVRSMPGKGATFVVEIPLVSEDSSSVKARILNPRSRGMR